VYPIRNGSEHRNDILLSRPSRNHHGIRAHLADTRSPTSSTNQDRGGSPTRAHQQKKLADPVAEPCTGCDKRDD
jgi:hypothetical protein